MNNKGQLGRLVVLFGLIVIGLMYFGGIAGGLGGAVCQATQSNNVTGLEGFFYCNINLVVFLFFIIALVGVAALSQ